MDHTEEAKKKSYPFLATRMRDVLCHDHFRSGQTDDDEEELKEIWNTDAPTTQTRAYAPVPQSENIEDQFEQVTVSSSPPSLPQGLRKITDKILSRVRLKRPITERGRDDDPSESTPSQRRRVNPSE